MHSEQTLRGIQAVVTVNSVDDSTVNYDITPALSQDQLQQAVARHCKLLILMGEDAPLLQQALSSSAPVIMVSSLEEAINVAATQAQAGDVVLLSPACASFDMFSGYVQRGEAFCALVKLLAENLR